MKAVATVLLPLALAALTGAPIVARADSAAFSVAITLHTALKQPQAPVQVCAQDRVLDLPVGAYIRVECPITASAEGGNGTASAASRTAAGRQVPQVLVAY